ncbi:MAG: ATP-binding protein [Hespellia sp.]|nr:ATP-binding protein [Hespellia sp.]
MRTKIQKSTELVLVITLLISYAVLTLVVYQQSLSIMKREVRQETDYIRTAVLEAGEVYLEDIDSIDSDTRITWVDLDGTVLYDSKEPAQTLENHNSRAEIKLARKNGSGEEIRISDTMGKQLFYYAILLDDGTVLRVSKTMDNVATTAFNMFPVMIILAILMIGLAWILSKWQTEKIIRPINQLDIEHPLENDVYEELTPLLVAIDTQNKEKDAIADMRKEFSANVSHELKTPLTSISGYAEIIQNGMVKEQDIPGFAGRIYKEARRLITLVEDIIKLSKLDDESVELEKENVDLYGLCREVCSRLAPQIEEKHVHVEVMGEQVYYRGIRQILDEMIYNICENGVKYNVTGGELSVWAGNTLNGPKVVISDSGIGIPKEHQGRIFERFYRVDKSHSKEHGGTGLGLSIVKHGALLHGAEVHVESAYGSGTKVIIQFPNGN